MIKSAYIHIPFCRQICSYCDFCKIFYNDDWVTKYLDALELEIKKDYKNEALDTIYIGGGTPSSLNINQLNKLFSIIKVLKLNKEYEFTFECNIEDITEEKIKLLKDNGVNRLSIGIESFNDKYLKFLNRNYTSDIIFDRINLAKKYFDNINIDLIYAIPGQTIDELESDLKKVKQLDVNHVSCYSLIIEDNTFLSINGIHPIDENLDSEMYEFIDNYLNNIYRRYEISNYSKEGYESKANLTYWNNEEYYGFGLSAASYINNVRYINTKNLTKYINNINEKEKEILTKDDKIKYEIILGLRLIKGINKNKFYEKYNKNIYEIDNIDKLIKQGYLIDDGNFIKVDKKYLYVLNDILINFI